MRWIASSTNSSGDTFFLRTRSASPNPSCWLYAEKPIFALLLSSKMKCRDYSTGQNARGILSNQTPSVPNQGLSTDAIFYLRFRVNQTMAISGRNAADPQTGEDRGGVEVGFPWLGTG